MVRFSKEYWLVLGLMAAAFAGNLWIRAPKLAGGDAVDLSRFPRQFQGWIAEDDSLDPATARLLHADQFLLRHYIGANGSRVGLFIGYYQDQKFGAQVHSPQHCLPGSGWTILRHNKFLLSAGPAANYANALHISKNTENQLVVYWFASGGRIVQNVFELKLSLLINAFTRKATSVYFCRLNMPLQKNEEKAAQETLAEFLRLANAYFKEIS